MDRLVHYGSSAPIIPLLILVPLLTYWLYPPEVKHSADVAQWAAVELQKIGRLSNREVLLALIVAFALFLWIAGGAFFSAATVALIAASLMYVRLAWRAHRSVRWTHPRRLRQVVRRWCRLAHETSLAAPGDGHSAGRLFHNALFIRQRGCVYHCLAIGYSLDCISIPGIPVKEFALLLSMELGIMGIITPLADAASPIYANSGYIPSQDYWRLGTIFGAIFLVVFLAIAVLGGHSFGVGGYSELEDLKYGDQ